LIRCRARVLEKGKKRRWVFFSADTQTYLREWRVDQRTGADHVFYSVRTRKPLTVSGLYQLLKRIAKKAGVGGHTNPHAWRHAFGINFMEDGGDSLVLSKLMGHKKVQLTADRYAIFDTDTLERMYEKHAPMLIIKKAKRSSE
jgi:site-specific recombinase XerD